MKTTILTMTLLSLMSISIASAQDKTTVTANNSEISDNLDLRAVASIFGDSKDLNDFEYRLNNPEYQISNLDLNNDNQVDYLRVIETVEGNAHLIIIQSVLGKDMFQDIATVEVTKDRDNRVQVQVVGDVYMYGTNYIYEPVYEYAPVIYTSFWAPRYRPYYSSWYWGYYPSYYVAWHPFPIFRYRNNIHVWINFNNHYNYVNTRYCGVVYNNYYRGRRGNAYETQHPNRSFAVRNQGYTNRHDLDKTRDIRTSGTRNGVANGNDVRTSRSDATTTRTANDLQGIKSSNTRSTTTRNTATIGSEEHNGTVRNNNTTSTVRTEQSVRTFAQNNTIRNVTPTRNIAVIKNEPTRNTSSQNTVRNTTTRNPNSGSTVKNTSPTRNTSNTRSAGSSASTRGTASGGSSRGSGRSR